MNRLSKFVIAGLAVAAMTGTALAQDPPADGTDPAATDPAAPAPTGDPAMTTDPMAPAIQTKSLGVDVIGVLPLGDYADISDFGIGGALRFEYGLKPLIAITARAGLIYNIVPEGIDSFLLIPVHVGAKYTVGTSGLFVQGELGITHGRV